MKRITYCQIVFVSLVIVLLRGAGPVIAVERSGKMLFEDNCMVCHPNGGNGINPQKTLRKKDLAANNIRTEDDIVKIIRNPGPEMSRFDEKMLSDGDARKIARYILSVLAK